MGINKGDKQFITREDEGDAREESAVAPSRDKVAEEAGHFGHRQEAGRQEEERARPEHSV